MDRAAEVVISGIAGKFPASSDVQDFYYKLLAGLDLVDDAETRWEHGPFDMPRRAGKLLYPETFDAEFFGTSKKQANSMDVMQRMLLEAAFEALLDAGINPAVLRGSSTGVFIGGTAIESFMASVNNPWQPNSYNFVGHANSILANRISYAFDLRGPSLFIDTACSAGLTCLQRAFVSIRSGECDQAIVASANTLCEPKLTLTIANHGMLSSDGTCRVFDASASGYVRSEAIAALFICKREVAKRVYTTLLQAKITADGYKDGDMNRPSAAAQARLLREAYTEVDVDVRQLKYLEAHGTGTPVGDPTEMEAIEQVLCHGRYSPLLIGSVKSNIGHTEPAAGLCSIVKLILSHINGVIPGNLYFKTPNPNLRAVISGKVVVVDRNIPWPGDLVGVSAFGFGGANSHVILRFENEPSSQIRSQLHSLVPVMGRTERMVEEIIEMMATASHQSNMELLLQNTFNENIDGYSWMGYGILRHGKLITSNLTKKASHSPRLYVLVVGLESHYLKLASSLTRFSVFESSIQAAAKALPWQLEGTEIIAAMREPEMQTSDPPKVRAMMTCCVQLALCDTLCKVLPKSIASFVSYTAGAEHALPFRRALSELVSPVPISEELDGVPSGSLVLQLGSTAVVEHLLLQKNCTVFKFPDSTQRQDVTLDFLRILGELHNNGAEVDVINLSAVGVRDPAVRSPPLSPFVDWEHSGSFAMPIIVRERDRHGGIIFQVSINHSDESFYRHHCLGKRIVFPATGYLKLVWDAFAAIRGTRSELLPIKFQDVSFEELIVLSNDEEHIFRVEISQADGSFAVLKDNFLVACKGRIEDFARDSAAEKAFYPVPDCKVASSAHLDTVQFYITVNASGFNYTGQFQSVQEYGLDGSWGTLRWDGSWVTFLDGMLQLNSFDYLKWRPVPVVPTRIQHVAIDPQDFLNSVKNLPKVKVRREKDLRLLATRGIQIRDVFVTPALLARAEEELRFSNFVFTPYHASAGQDFTEDKVLQACIQIIIHELSNSPLRILYCVPDATGDNDAKVWTESIMGTNVTFVRRERLELAGNVMKGADDSNEFHLAMVSQDDFYHAAALHSIQFVLLRACSDWVLPASFIKIAQYTTSAYTYYLLRTQPPLQTEARAVIQVTPQSYGWVERLKEALSRTYEKEGIIVLYCSGQSISGILGLVASLRREPNTQHIRCFLNLDSEEEWDFDQPSKCLQRQLALGLVFNVKLNGQWGFYCNFMIHNSAIRGRRALSHSAHALVSYGGGKSTLRIEEKISLDSPSQHQNVHVHYVGLNFRDAMTVHGKLLPVNTNETEYRLGLEFSGTTSGGERVFGVSLGCLATDVTYDKTAFLPVPSDWSLPEAASVPVCWATALYALQIKAQLQPKESVLIHAGAGGVGLACIGLALESKCTVYATVGSRKKKSFLLRYFRGQLWEENIFDSRSFESFESAVMKATGGKGVDVVVNSLSGSSLLASIRCVGENGRFVELGKADILKDSKVGLLAMRKGVDIFFCDLYQLLSSQSALLGRLLTLLREKVASGTVKPLPLTVYDLGELDIALEKLLAGTTTGKVVVKMGADISRKLPASVLAIPKVYFDPSKAYILIGGLGGMGLEILKWMVGRGMRKALLISRTGITTEYRWLVLNLAQEYGCEVRLCTEDLYNLESCVAALRDVCDNLSEVDGIFNMAAELDDGLFANQTPERFEKVCRPKVDLTMAMDYASRKCGLRLRFFVVFSSITANVGNAGQANYGYANSAMEMIVDRRRREGLSGVAIQWGPVENVGLLKKETVKLNNRGFEEHSITSCLAALDYLLLQESATVISCCANSSPMRKKDDEQEVLTTFLRIFGKQSLDPADASRTFEEIGMDSLITAEVKVQLTKFNLENLLKKPPGSITFADIQALTTRSAPREEEESSKLLIDLDNSWFMTFDINYNPQTSVVKLQSSSSPVGVNLFLVHTLDGTSKYLRNLAAGLHVNVWGLQCAPNAPLSTVEELATYYLRHIQQIQAEGPYFIGGYSYGGLVATELALQLEALSSTPNLCILLDGTPYKVEKLLSSIVLSSGLGIDITSILAGVNMFGLPVTRGLEKALKSASEPRKMAKAAAVLCGEGEHACGVIETAIFRFHRLFKMAMEYTSRGFLSRCQVILLKATINPYRTDALLSTNYDLEKIADNIQRYDIKGDHRCFYEGPKELGVIEIINQAIETSRSQKGPG